MFKLSLLVFALATTTFVKAENGYRLWLRYNKVDNQVVLAGYRQQVSGIYPLAATSTLSAASNELTMGLTGLLGKPAVTQKNILTGSVVFGPMAALGTLDSFFNAEDKKAIGNEGYIIRSITFNKQKITVITANTDVGVLYGIFGFLRLLQSQQDISKLSIATAPSIQRRLLNHWDNLDRHVERGYAGISIWNWHTLPGYIDQRYIDYARANASIGINGTVLTNVNANALVLTEAWLQKVQALANTFRPYGIKVYLTARFSAPIEIGKLPTADPLNTEVRNWWKEKAKEIYASIPDFGGFVVKANSEGQPGPQNYGRTHADGANMLAEAVAPFGGIVMWRAFVYDPGKAPEAAIPQSFDPSDRTKQAYDEFTKLDGKFNSNVLVQVKNGPLDFQPREPFSPLFGAMKQTPLTIEFQLTQEYLGQSTHLVYEAPMFKEVLQADTYAQGKSSTVAKIIDGSLDNETLSGIAGVANIGNDINWTGHPFAQANWYTFGRLAWNHNLSSEQIADEWIKQTFGNNPALVTTVTQIMMRSHQTLVNYMTPLGLHHIMNNGHHYGPAPWANTLPRPDWNPVYYHRADSTGIGFDRTGTGSNALAQYAPEVQKQFADINTCPDDYLLWFHRVPWTHKMASGRNLWQELCFKYNQGVDSVQWMEKSWRNMKPYVDAERYKQVSMLLSIQVEDAIWWRDACLAYFKTFANMPIPSQYPQPAHTLQYYQSLKFPYAPGN